MIYVQVEKEYFEELKEEAKRLQVDNEYLHGWISYLKNRSFIERVFNVDNFTLFVSKTDE